MSLGRTRKPVADKLDQNTADLDQIRLLIEERAMLATEYAMAYAAQKTSELQTVADLIPSFLNAAATVPAFAHQLLLIQQVMHDQQAKLASQQDSINSLTSKLDKVLYKLAITSCTCDRSPSEPQDSTA